MLNGKLVWLEEIYREYPKAFISYYYDFFTKKSRYPMLFLDEPVYSDIV